MQQQQQRLPHPTALTPQHAPANLALLMGGGHPYFNAIQQSRPPSIQENALFMPAHGKKAPAFITVTVKEIMNV